MYYNLRRIENGYRIVNFDKLFNVQAVYDLKFSRGRFYCNCPAGHRPSCKHRDMIPMFLDKKAVDTGEFLYFDTGEWLPAVVGRPDDTPALEPLPLKKKRQRKRRKPRYV